MKTPARELVGTEEKRQERTAVREKMGDSTRHGEKQRNFKEFLRN